ncbi:MAG TPA: TetR/AcrR family transcriptional regulator [Candidatus Binatia bacterium]|nr:TetR/AcrR family transcriptional regulator [Candidatus Binatia bacterium]
MLFSDFERACYNDTVATKGTATRRQILLRAADLASAEGLEGLSIGRLSEALGMSKSGLFAHFGSKEELQLAVLETARDLFAAEVLAPAAAEPPGLSRLVAVVQGWLRHVEHPVFRGGCFFAAAAAEWDDRPGRVRDRVVAITRQWFSELETGLLEAAARGHLRADSDAAQLAFELHAFLHAANLAYQLHGDAQVFARARSAIRRVLLPLTHEHHTHVLDDLA